MSFLDGFFWVVFLLPTLHQGEGRVQADERRHQAGGAPAQQVPGTLTRPLQARTARLTRAQGMDNLEICTVQ